MIDYKSLTVEQQAQMEIEKKYLKRSIVLTIIPAACAIFARVYFLFYPETACMVSDNIFLLAIWPQNLLLRDQLYASHFAANDKCLFLAMHSIFAIGWILWLLLKIVDEAMRTDRLFIPGFAKGFTIALTVSLVSIFTRSFKEHLSLYSLSFGQSLEVGLWKNLPLVFLFFFSFGYLVDRGLAFLRSVSGVNQD